MMDRFREEEMMGSEVIFELRQGKSILRMLNYGKLFMKYMDDLINIYTEEFKS